MNWVDLSILAIIGVSVTISVWRGFTKEAFSLIGWVIAAWVGLAFADNIQSLLSSQIDSLSLRLVVAFAILFVSTLLLAAIANHLATQLIQSTGLGGTDRVVGIIFGVLRGCFVVAVMVMVAGLTPLPTEKWWQASTLLPIFQDMALWLRDFLPNDIATLIHY